MFNLIKKEIVKVINNEANNIFKYILIFLVLYIGFNNLFYSGISILLSYMVIGNIFNHNEKVNSKSYINKISCTYEDIVFVRYLIATVIIVIMNLLIIFIMKISSILMFRGIVFNDVVFSVNTFLIIMSIVIPIFFRYGYHNVRFLCGTLGIIIYCIFGSFINMFNDRIYELEYFKLYQAKIILNDYSGTFSKAMSKIVYGIDQKYLSLFFITTLIIILFIFSMYISLRIIKNREVNHEEIY